jgi:hypothetical protein
MKIFRAPDKVAPEKFEPEEAGFGVIRVLKPTEVELGIFYRELKEKQGVYIEEMEKYLPLVERVAHVALFTDDPDEQAEIEAIDRSLEQPVAGP